MTYNEFFEAAGQKFEGSMETLFCYALEDVIEGGNSIKSNPADWQERKISGDSAVMFYGMFIHALRMRAGQLASIGYDDPVWQQATDILAVLRQILMDDHDDGDLDLFEVEIMSPSREAEAAGMATITEGQDGERYLKPTPEFMAVEQAADEVRKSTDSESEPGRN